MAELLETDEYRIIWLIRRLFQALGQKSNDSLRDLGVSAADRAVMEFLRRENALSVPEIAQRYQVSRQHVQVTVNNLLAKKLVATRNNPRHKRSPFIALTANGRTLFARIEQRDSKAIQQLFSGVPAKDRCCTLRTLEALFSHMTQGDGR